MLKLIKLIVVQYIYCNLPKTIEFFRYLRKEKKLLQNGRLRFALMQYSESRSLGRSVKQNVVVLTLYALALPLFP